MTCFGCYIGRLQVVHSLILKQTIQYTTFFVSVNQISCTSIKSAFKITTVPVELKSSSEIKDRNSIKSCLATLVFWLPGSAVMVSSWQMVKTHTLLCSCVSRGWWCVYALISWGVFLKKWAHTHIIVLYLQLEIVGQFSRNYSKCDFYKLNYIYKDSGTLSLSTTITIPC